MPVYCFKTQRGKIVERVFPMGKCPDTITLPRGRSAGRDIAAEWRGSRATPSNWPMESSAVGVNPEEVGAAHQESVNLGVPTEFNPATGDAILRDAHHRKRYCEALGFYDRNGGYGDPRKNK